MTTADKRRTNLLRYKKMALWVIGNHGLSERRYPETRINTQSEPRRPVS